MDRLNDVASTLADPLAHCEARSGNGSRSVLDEGPVPPSMHECVARIVRTIEADIIPRLVRSHRPTPDAAASPVGHAVDKDDVLRFVGLAARVGAGATAGDGRRAAETAEALLNGRASRLSTACEPPLHLSRH